MKVYFMVVKQSN